MAWVATNGKDGADIRYRRWRWGWQWTTLAQHATQFARREDVEQVFGEDEDTWCAIRVEPLHEQLAGAPTTGSVAFQHEYSNGTILLIALCWLGLGMITGWYAFALWH